MKKLKNTERTKFTLPTTKSEVISHLGGYVQLIYGEKKIGKTTLFQHFPKTLFMMFERGAKGINVYQRNLTSWKQFKMYNSLICQDKFFDTVLIDVADIAYDMCSTYVCNKLGIEHPADASWGKGWGAVKAEFKKEIRKLTNSGKGIVFISHQKIVEIERRDGKKYNIKTSTLSAQAGETITGDVDMWFNYDFDNNGKRVLTLIGDSFTEAGHRLNEPPNPKFLYTNGEPIKKLNMGKSSKEAYETFIKAFNNRLEKPVVKLRKKRS